MNGEDHLERAILRNLLEQTTRAYEDKIAELHAETELANVTLASIADAVVTSDLDGTVTFLNRSAERLTGWSRTAAVGRPVGEVVVLEPDELEGRGAALLAGDAAGTTAIATAIHHVSLRARNGARCAVEGTVAPLRDRDGGRVGLVAVLRDVSEPRLLALQMAHQATHDALTGLLNRHAFERRLREAITSVHSGGGPHCLCFLDLDQFKLVNDSCGHLAGDELLRRIAGLLQEKVRATDVLGRLGGDEFGVLLISCGPRSAVDVARELCAAVQSYRFGWEDRVYTVSASIGLVQIEPGLADVSDVLRVADHSCYVAKERGRNRVQMFAVDDTVLAERLGESRLVLRVREALEGDGFRLFAQPITALVPELDGGLRFEVLLRMRGAAPELYPPAHFVATAERYGIVGRLDRWVVRHVITTLAKLDPARRVRIDRCFVNLSATTIGDEDFPGYVTRLLKEHRVVPAMLGFEVTETAAVRSIAVARNVMQELIDLGCRFALDDFGQGVSSYGHVRDLPVDWLKIDGVFVQDMAKNDLDRAMVESINQIAHLLGLETVAESVSSPVVLEMVTAAGIDWAQGDHIAPPRPIAKLLATLCGRSGALDSPQRAQRTRRSLWKHAGSLLCNLRALCGLRPRALTPGPRGRAPEWILRAWLWRGQAGSLAMLSRSIRW